MRNQWRSRSPVSSEGADVMIGMSYLGMGHPDDTLKQIEPYMAKATNDPNTYDEIILLYARSLLAKGQGDSAEERLYSGEDVEAVAGEFHGSGGTGGAGGDGEEVADDGEVGAGAGVGNAYAFCELHGDIVSADGG